MEQKEDFVFEVEQTYVASLWTAKETCRDAVFKIIRSWALGRKFTIVI